MVEQIKILINASFDDINKSPELALSLVKIYSILFFGGKDPGAGCSVCMQKFHKEIIQNGLKRYEDMKNKTCVMKEGIVWVNGESKHFSDKNITDEKAIELLEKGWLKEKHFLVLPKTQEKVDPLELIKENKGNFTSATLTKMNGSKLIDFSELIIGEKAESKNKAIQAILKWQVE